MKNQMRAITVVSFVAVLIATGEPTGASGSFSTLQLILAGVGVTALILSTLTMVRMDKNEEDAKALSEMRSRQTEMVSAELAFMAGNGNKLAAKLK